MYKYYKSLNKMISVNNLNFGPVSVVVQIKLKIPIDTEFLGDDRAIFRVGVYCSMAFHCKILNML
jgi:hypothetical protein